jgi:hypothetical protein
MQQKRLENVRLLQDINETEFLEFRTHQKLHDGYLMIPKHASEEKHPVYRKGLKFCMSYESQTS